LVQSFESRTPPLTKPEVVKKHSLGNLVTIKELGRGSFGKVKLVRDTLTNEYYAMKCLSKENIRSKK
jgi:serine/threonine protein kinase